MDVLECATGHILSDVRDSGSLPNAIVADLGHTKADVNRTLSQLVVDKKLGKYTLGQTAIYVLPGGITLPQKKEEQLIAVRFRCDCEFKHDMIRHLFRLGGDQWIALCSPSIFVECMTGNRDGTVRVTYEADGKHTYARLV